MLILLELSHLFCFIYKCDSVCFIDMASLSELLFEHRDRKANNNFDLTVKFAITEM